HYISKDIFTYISYASTMDNEPDTIQFRKHKLKINDTIFYSSGYMILNKISLNPKDTKHKVAARDTLLVADLTLVGSDSIRQKAYPAISIKGDNFRFLYDTIFTQNLAVGFTSVDKQTGEVELQVKESERMIPFVALKVYEFPQINVLWLGTVIMILGFCMSIRRRFLLARRGDLAKA
ncbi:MAG: cytochrome c assembly protein, partial [Gemmatimonadaceae bacterium]|nr:cytochrome c assembly protein [Chitinophagaceae bacterium]